MSRKKACYGLAGLFVAALLFIGVSAEGAQKAVGLPKVLIIGDSISMGYTGKVRELLTGKAEIVRARTDKGKVINCGSSEMGLAGIDGWLGETKWDVIHFNWGLWDICYRNPESKIQGNRDKVHGTVTATPEVYEANLRQLVAKLKATGAKLIWATTTPVPDSEIGRKQGDAAKYNAIAAKVMKENGIAIDDLYSHMLPVAKEYYIGPGNVHYTKEGSGFLAVKVAAAIEDAIAPQTMLLWPGGSPGAKGEEAKDKPTITAYLPARESATGAAVVICPGGGYRNVAKGHEGVQVARWLNSFGVAGFVVDYRNMGKGYAYPAPQMDGRRAMRIVRNRAVQWGIDKDKIGVLGFSAGGHLASTVGTLFGRDIGNSEDDLSEVSCRPDFMVLCYPVISMTESFAHKGSKRNLLGDTQVTGETPTTFLLHADDDAGVQAENSVAFYTALREAKVAAEMHVYEKGGHGFGLGKGKGAVEGWAGVCREWILAR